MPARYHRIHGVLKCIPGRFPFLRSNQHNADFITFLRCIAFCIAGQFFPRDTENNPVSFSGPDCFRLQQGVLFIPAFQLEKSPLADRSTDMPCIKKFSIRIDNDFPINWQSRIGVNKKFNRISIVNDGGITENSGIFHPHLKEKKLPVPTDPPFGLSVCRNTLVDQIFSLQLYNRRKFRHGQMKKRKAIARLAEDKLVKRRPGAGTTVSGRGESAPLKFFIDSAGVYSPWYRVSSFRRRPKPPKERATSFSSSTARRRVLRTLRNPMESFSSILMMISACMKITRNLRGRESPLFC